MKHFTEVMPAYVASEKPANFLAARSVPLIALLCDKEDEIDIDSAYSHVVQPNSPW